MLKFGTLRLAISHLNKSFSIEATHKPFVKYGNVSMNDKLYKTVELEMKGAEPQVLQSYGIFITQAANELGIKVGETWKHMVQYEVRTHYKWMQFHKMTGSTADTFLEYIERMLPEGVALKVTRLSIEPLPLHIKKDEILKVLTQAGENVPESAPEEEKTGTYKAEQQVLDAQDHQRTNQ